MTEAALDGRILAARLQPDIDGNVMIPISWFERCQEALEEAHELAAAYEARREMDRDGGIPFEVMNDIHAGVHPLVAWRKYRRWSQAHLASAANLTQAAVARLESLDPGCGRLDTLDRLANALDAPRWTLNGPEPATSAQKLRRGVSRQAQPGTERVVRAAAPRVTPAGR